MKYPILWEKSRNVIIISLLILFVTACNSTQKLAVYPLDFYEVEAKGAPPQMKVRMISNYSKIGPEQEFKIGFFFKLSEGWYTYSPKKGGDNIPTELTLELPEGFKIIDEQWPLPVLSTGKTEGDRELVYNEDFKVIFSILAPAVVPQEFSITAFGSWQICEGNLCTLGSANLELELQNGNKKSKMFKMFFFPNSPTP